MLSPSPHPKTAKHPFLKDRLLFSTKQNKMGHTVMWTAHLKRPKGPSRVLFNDNHLKCVGFMS